MKRNGMTLMNPILFLKQTKSICKAGKVHSKIRMKLLINLVIKASKIFLLLAKKLKSKEFENNFLKDKKKTKLLRPLKREPK